MPANSVGHKNDKLKNLKMFYRYLYMLCKFSTLPQNALKCAKNAKAC